MGASIEFSNTAPFILEKISGTGNVNTSINSMKPAFYDGNIYQSNSLEQREVILQGSILSRDLDGVFNLKSKMISTFNPKLGQGTLKYETPLGNREIKCIAEIVFSDKYRNVEKFVITLTCDNPLWLDSYKRVEKMAYILGGLKFPLRLNTKFTHRSFKKKIINKGDVDTPLSITFFGPASTPIIKNNTTGEFIKVNFPIAEGEKLVINTEFGNKKVEIVKKDASIVDAFNYIDLESTFFDLQIGENILEFGTGDDTKKAYVIVEYQNRYIGV